jgi:hypothetical protein
MKSRIYWSLSLGSALAVLAFSGGQPQEFLSQPTNNAPALPQNVAPDVAPQATNTTDPVSAEQPAEDDVVDAPVQPISSTKPLPSNVKLAGPAAEVMRLANSGLDEAVMLAFVTNSTSIFNLSAEEIIYLNDIGVSSAVVTAMIQHDQALKQLSANAAPAPAAPVPSPAQPEPAPPPEEMAPQPADTTEAYVPPADSTYTTFYDSLAPYGTWVDVAGYGPCWQPTVVVINRGWRPYCDGGRWLYTDCGWYWSSGYSWGWAPFHYGRWFRHRHMGWCWAPGNVWGPSWVSWRYSGNYCGWAPLPPAAGFSVGVGLTFHGNRVNSSFGFGLGVNSFSFVSVSQFSNPHLNRYAVPHSQATQIYRQTVPSTTIVGNQTRVINRGIPVSRVEGATHTQIRRIGIREVNTPTAQGVRGERFDSHSRTLSVFRPHFPPSAGTQPASGGRQQPGSGGRSRSEMRNGSSGATLAPTPALTAPSAASVPPARTYGRTTITQPNSTSRFGRRAEGPVTGSTPTPASRTSDPAPAPATPSVLRGSDRSGQTTAGSSATAINQATPRSSLTVIGKREASPWQAASRPSAPVTETPRSRPTAPPQDTPSRSVVNPTAQPIATPSASAPSQSRWTQRAAEPFARTERPRQFTAPSYSAPAQVPRTAPAPAAEVSRPQSPAMRQDPLPRATVNEGPQPVISSARSAPHLTAPHVRSEPQRQYTAPSYQAPAAVPRVAPAPAPAPQQMRSYSPPASSFTPRAQVMESRSASAAPSTPAASSSPGHSQSSSGRGRR